MRFPSGQKHRHWGRAFMTSWQLIFLQSRVNNGAYAGDYLPAQKWDWPRDTWFQTRLCYRRVQRGEITGNRSRAQEIDWRSTDSWAKRVAHARSAGAMCWRISRK